MYDVTGQKSQEGGSQETNAFQCGPLFLENSKRKASRIEITHQRIDLKLLAVVPPGGASLSRGFPKMLGLGEGGRDYELLLLLLKEDIRK